MIRELALSMDGWYRFVEDIPSNNALENNGYDGHYTIIHDICTSRVNHTILYH
jgi:hypothetical protein